MDKIIQAQIERERRAAAQTEPQIAFLAAIAAGVLSDQERDANYAGDYMYMGKRNGQFEFKHIDSRQYVMARDLAA